MLRWFKYNNLYSFFDEKSTEISMLARGLDDEDGLRNDSYEDFSIRRHKYKDDDKNIIGGRDDYEQKYENILNVASVYGANASGKSNLIKALSSVFWNIFGGESGRLVGECFLYDETSKKEPIVCEMSVSLKNKNHDITNSMDLYVEYRYHYTLTHPENNVKNKNYIVSKEWLKIYSVGAPCGTEPLVTLYSRTNGVFDEGCLKAWDSYSISQLMELTKKVESENSLVLYLIGKVVDISEKNEKFKCPEPISDFMDWCRLSIPPHVFSDNELEWQHEIVAKRIYEDLKNKKYDYKNDFLVFLRQFDTSIADIKIVKFEDDDKDEDEEEQQTNLNIYKKRTGYNIKIIRQTIQGNDEEIFISEESYGTQKVAAVYRLFERIWRNGGLAIIDEIDTKLHPYIILEIIKRFHLNTTNTEAQLVFTSHNLVALDKHYVHMDGIYFVSKNEDTGKSTLRRFTRSEIPDAEINVSYSNLYMEGKLGAVQRHFHAGRIPLEEKIFPVEDEEKI